MKHIDGAQPQFHEIYLALTLFGNRIQSYESKLIGEFESVQQRINLSVKLKQWGVSMPFESAVRQYSSYERAIARGYY